MAKAPATPKPTRAGPATKGASLAANPHMTAAFARAYERAATRTTGPVSMAALNRLGAVGRETRILDIGAGAGAFSVPAAHTGASVTAIDVAPGMVEVLAERLEPFPGAEALLMNGQELDFAESSFDAAVSIVGITLFEDWRRGLAEQVRVLRPGGSAIVATWRVPPGGGPFIIMGEAMRAVFPDQPAPTPPDGFRVLADPEAMAAALLNSGLVDVAVDEIETAWDGPAGPAYLEELREFHPYMGPYGTLAASDRERVDSAILEAVGRRAVDGRVVLTTPVVLATGRRPTVKGS